MTPESQRIAIAEICGWESCSYYANGQTWGFYKGKDGSELPNYPNSLDAMHEAEKVLTQQQQRGYWTHLLAIRSRDTTRPATENSKDTFAFMATAAQRAEAFLKVFNLWKL